MFIIIEFNCFVFEGIHQEGLLRDMLKMRIDLENKWIDGTFEGSQKDFEELVESDERMLNLVLESRKPSSAVLDRRWKHSQGVAEIADGSHH